MDIVGFAFVQHPTWGLWLLFELLCLRSVGRKDAPCGRCFLRVRTSKFFGAAKDCPRSVGCGFRLLCPFVSLCSAGSSLSRRVGRCPTPCRGSAPVPAKGYRALGWAECASRLVFHPCSARRLSILFSAQSLARRSWVQGHAPAAVRGQHPRPHCVCALGLALAFFRMCGAEFILHRI